MIGSWGNYPKINTNVFRFGSEDELKKTLLENSDLISRGNGRSYGDSALNINIVHTIKYRYFISFNERSGLLHCTSGVLLSEILEIFLRRGWFLKVTPGTKFITIGGAIASDVHGKNHHIDGCFSESVESFRLMLPNGDILNVSRNENRELFLSTCGGMGLTGVIIDAKIYLKKINSKNINQTTIKTRNLKETFDAFEKYKNKPYSVAWIDCLAGKEKMGRGLLMTGKFSDDGDLYFKERRKLTVFFNLPKFTLNRLSAKAFNSLYYNKIKEPISEQQVDIDTFFYPLDSINNWNRIYGKDGFIQYQFILPKEKSYEGLEEILRTVSSSNKSSFLSVLKLHGKENDNYLSFPEEGYSLALDFKIENGLFDFLNKLDRIILKYDGRIYLAKDARVPGSIFEKGYEKINQFRKIRKEYGLYKKFSSLQSERIGI